jgi:hypothetical protein
MFILFVFVLFANIPSHMFISVTYYIFGCFLNFKIMFNAIFWVVFCIAHVLHFWLYIY